MPVPAIMATVCIYNKDNSELLERLDLVSDVYSIYRTGTAIPSLRQYFANGGALYEQDLMVAAKQIAAGIARPYNYH